MTSRTGETRCSRLGTRAEVSGETQRDSSSAEADVGAAGSGYQGTEPLAEEEQEDVVADAAAGVVFAVVVAVAVENKTDGRVVSHNFPEAEEHGSVVLEIKFIIKY